jgi:Predicted integral membrane protein (DUF2269)
MYLFALYLHFVALIVAFFATGLVVGGGILLRKADRVAGARFALGLSARAAKLHPIATLGLFVTGAYMTQSSWSWTTPWIVCGIIGLVVATAVGVGVLGSRERRLEQMLRAAPEGAILPELREHLNDPVSNIAGPAVSVFVLGIIFVMVMKPNLAIGLLSLAVAAILGVAVGYVTQPARTVRSTA